MGSIVTKRNSCKESDEEDAAMDTTQMQLKEKFWRSIRNHLAAVALHLQLSNAEPPRSTGIENLPEEVLVKIFSFLNVQQLENTVSQVCRLWHGLSKRTSLRRKLTLEGVKNRDGTAAFLTPKAAEQDTAFACKLLHSCPNLRDLSITGRNDAHHLLPHVALYSNELRRLSVKNCSVQDMTFFIRADLINNLLLRCPRLVDLTIKRTDCEKNELFFDIVAKLPELRKININFSFSVDSMALRMMALHCRKLEEIRLLGRRSPAFGVREDEVVLLAQRLRGSLRVLKIDGIKLSDSALAAIVQCCHLRSLCIRNATDITDDGVFQLSRLRNLEKLDLTEMRSVSSSGWARLFSGSCWSQMKKLSVTMSESVNDNTVRQIAHYYPNLVKLNLTGCTNVTQEGLLSVFESCRDLETLNISLTHLLAYTSFFLIPCHIPYLKRLMYYVYGLEKEKIALSFLRHALPELNIIDVKYPEDELLREYDNSQEQ